MSEFKDLLQEITIYHKEGNSYASRQVQLCVNKMEGNVKNEIAIIWLSHFL